MADDWQPVEDWAPVGQNPPPPPKALSPFMEGLKNEGADLGRQLGLTGRYLVEGAAALPATIADIPVAAYNTGANLIQGKDKGFRFPEQNRAISQALSKIGLPQPQTGGERIVGDISRGMVGAGSTAGLASDLASASPLARALAQSPGKAVISGGLSGGAGGGAREADLPVPVQMAASLAAGALPYISPSALASGGELSPAEQRSMDAGYKLPPATMENPSILSKVLGGWSGKIKTQQGASAENQEVTNSIAAKDLGLPHDSTLDDSTFDNLRRTAGQAYEAVKKVAAPVVPDEKFLKDVDTLGNLNSQLAEHFPELVKNDDISSLSETLANKDSFPAAAGIDAVKTLRASATKNIQAIGDPQKNALGFAQRQAADAIDGLIERNISASGNSSLVANYKAARTLLAKSYDVQAATNPATGDVSAAKLAQIAQRRPIGGGLQTIADAANSFPKATQSPAKFGGTEPLSVLDIIGALGSAGTGAMSGHPLEGAGLAATVLSRPAARALILSNAYQRAISNPSTASSASYLPSQLQPLLNALNQGQ